MSAKVRFVRSHVALAFDPQHGRMVKVVRSIDTKGRQWEEHSADGGGRPTLIEPPDEPRKRRNVKRTHRR